MENNSNLTTQSYIHRYPKEDDLYVLYVTIKVTIGFVIIAVNILVISLYCWKKRKLLTIPSNRLLLSLLICEFLTGIAVVMSAVCNIYPICRYPDKTHVFTYRIMVDIITTFLVKTVVIHLCGITLDRYISVFYALKYQSIVTKKAIKCYIIISWCVPLIVSTLQLSWLHRIMTGNRSEDDMKAITDIEIWYSMVSFGIFLAIPMFLLAAAFLAMFFEIRRLLYCVPRHHVVQVSSKQRRIIYVFCLMYVTFLVLAMPYFSLRLWIDIHYWMRDNVQLNKTIMHLTIIVKNLTSIVNPVLYTTTSPEHRSLLIQFGRKTPTIFSFEKFHKLSSESLQSLRRLSSFQRRHDPRDEKSRVEKREEDILLQTLATMKKETTDPE